MCRLQTVEGGSSPFGEETKTVPRPCSSLTSEWHCLFLKTSPSSVPLHLIKSGTGLKPSTAAAILAETARGNWKAGWCEGGIVLTFHYSAAAWESTCPAALLWREKQRPPFPSLRAERHVGSAVDGLRACLGCLSVFVCVDRGRSGGGMGQGMCVRDECVYVCNKHSL